MTRRTLVLLSLALATVASAVTTINGNRTSDHPHAAYDSECLHVALKTRQALDEYQKSHEGVYPALLDGLVPDQLAGLPYCPESRRPFTYTADGNRYLFYCEGGRAAQEAGFIPSYRIYSPDTKVRNHTGAPPGLGGDLAERE